MSDSEEKKKSSSNDTSDDSIVDSESEISESDEEESSEESEDSSFELDDVEIHPDDSVEVKNLKIKLLKEKSKVLDAKETIGSLVDQITAYKVSVEEEKLVLETQLKQEKKTKFELYEIYKEMELEKENISKQLDIVILECEQLDKEKQTISKENINNLQTLMNEITTIEETNSHLEKELEKEKELHQQTTLNYQNQCQLVQKLEAYNKELSTFSTSSVSSSTTSGSNDQVVIQLKKQLLDAQALLSKEKDKLLNIDNLLFQARKIVGVAESNGGQLDQNSMFEISQLKSNVGEEKQAHHKTQLLLEEEKKKSELNKKTADNLVARMKELISSHHETLQLLDDERENAKGLMQEVQSLKDQFNKFPQTSNISTPLTATALNNLNNENTPPVVIVGDINNNNVAAGDNTAAYEEGKLKHDPSLESISSQSSNGGIIGGNNASNLMGDAYLSMKYSAKMYKTIRLKKNSAASQMMVGNKPPMSNDLSMMFQPTQENKPTSPETNNNNNSNSNANTITTTTTTSSNEKKEVVFEPNKFSSKNSLKLGGGVIFNANDFITTNNNNNADGKFISYSTSSNNLVGGTTSPNENKKLTKAEKEREKKLEKEKKTILKKIEKDLKKKEKENNSKTSKSSPLPVERKSSSASQTSTPSGNNSNPETPKEPSPLSSKSNSVSSLRDSFEPNTTPGSGNSVELGGSISGAPVTSADKSPSLSGNSLSVKDKRKSRFFS